MSTSTSGVTAHFQYPTLDRIQGEPTFEGFKTLKQQLKANTQSVGSPTNFGYLGLVLTQNEFAQVSQNPFERPLDPVDLTIPVFAPAHETLQRQSRHEENKRKYYECHLVVCKSN